jgi:hypothetical protein
MEETNNQEIGNQNVDDVNINLISLNGNVLDENTSQIIIELLEFTVSMNNLENNEDDISANDILDTQVSVSEPINEQTISDINSSNSIRRSILEYRNLLNNNQNNILEQFLNTFNNLNTSNNLIVDQPTFSNSIFDNVISQSLNQPSLYKNVISDEGKTTIKKIKYKSNDVFNASCPISLVDFEEEQEVIALPCNHCFFPESIEKWLQEEKAECPVCRFKLKSKEIKYNEDDNNNNNNNNIMRNFIQHNTLNDHTLLNQRNNLFRSLRNSYTQNYFSDITEHPYGPSRQLEVIPHSYITNVHEENNDIELAIYLSLHNN